MHEPWQSFHAAIVSVLGHAPDIIEAGRFLRFSTSERRGDDAGWCKLFDDLRSGVFGCYRQGISEVWSADARSAMTREQRAAHARQVLAATVQRQAQRRQQWDSNARRIGQLWDQCVPLVPGDPCALYLKRRGFGGVWPLPDVLRMHGALPYWHEGVKLGAFAAMVAPVVAPDGRIVTLHRTYLTVDGGKADVPSPKKLTGAAGPTAGACIPLHRPVRGCIGIAEGIETALAAWCAGSVPTVAAYCAANLAAWQWPAGVQRLMIFADADRAGRAAAEALRVRAAAARLRCDVLVPSDDGADWCDVWATGGAAAAAEAGAA